MLSSRPTARKPQRGEVMAPKYLQVSPHIHTPAFRSLRQNYPKAYELRMYHLTCRHRNSEGLFWLPIQYQAIDIGMTEEEVNSALHVLHEHGYSDYDHEAEVILDRMALDYYKPKGASQIKGAINKLESVPQTPLKRELVRVAFIRAPDFADELIAAFPQLDPTDTLKTGSREGVDRATTVLSKSKSSSTEEERESESESGQTPHGHSELEKVNSEW